MNLKEIQPMLDQLPPEMKAEALNILITLEEIRSLEGARTNFLDFVKVIWPEFIMGDHHKIMAEAFDRVARGELKRLIINMPPRHRLLLSTPVLTTDGWKTIGTVQAGESVFDPQGRAVRVVGVSDTYEEKIYEVETTDGHVIETDAGHLWSVSYLTRGHQGFDKSFKKMSTKDIFERGTPSRGGPYLPRFDAIQGRDVDLPIDPYVLGVWLGDGTKYGAAIGCAARDEAEMRGLIEGCGYKTSGRDGYQMFGILGLHKQLREENLLQNKHIPDIYFTASFAQRLKLLQGLMDTDGSVGKGGRCTFHQTDEKLVRQVCSLINTLGATARVTTRQTSYGEKPSQPSFRINFRLANAAKLSRKASRLPSHCVQRGRAITVRETDRVAKVRCIEVANEDGLFLVGENMVVTSNTKSMFSSYLFPAWYLGLFPNKKVIQASHTGELAVGFGRQVRNLINSEEYHQVFDGVTISADNKAAGRWNTNKGGTYFATGVGGTMTGIGADILMIDDPHSEQDAAQGAYNPEIYDKVYEWYTSGPRQRLQPNGAIIVIQTRWSKRDLTGQLLNRQTNFDGIDQWEVIELPAILPSGQPLWPGYWSLRELEALKAELPIPKWEAQYQQNPTSEAGAIIKREMWRIWEGSKPPPVKGVIMSWDTAYEKTSRADPSACTVWGIFDHADENGTIRPNLILLYAWSQKVEFPELKKKVKEFYNEWEPDQFIIEKKASGAPLIYELRAMGIPVTEFTPTRGNDKLTRVNAVTDIFSSGFVWAPQTHWAEEVIEQCAAFPNGDHDDLLDTCTQALLRFRQGGWIMSSMDEEDEDDYHPPPVEYY